MSAAPGALRIAGEMGIYRAEELKQMLLAAVAAQPALELDLSGVSEFDGAGLQLLLLARDAARAAGGALRLAAPSGAVLDVLALTGLGGSFGAPAPAAGAAP
ncbi:STAS domain-containing protein [Pseudoduganella sp. LjRoot289]|uniref:STAS domain-containing protein n=1 Tax=Pseudoduganella sp. LjRoot289 TaxID=3342314 RepID=UPI003ED09E19